ncbi:MAG: GSCFA domain-containing protein [Bacteroidota bacterium]
MSSFRTELIISPAAFQWGLGNPVLTLGSCFAEVMGRQLAENKLPVLINPFGTIFNPVSISQLITQSVNNALPTDVSNSLFTQRYGCWFHHNFHSRFTANSQEALQQQISLSLNQTNGFLQQTDVVLLTFGTAWAHRLKETGTVVANCHKLPATHFDRHLLTTQEIAAAFDSSYRALKAIRPQLHIILTVSPVRHLKDTIPLNQVSKSTLRLACHELTQRFGDVHYFPSYEFMMDDLRDYRFYQPDMIHPTEVAEAYIWQKFSDIYLNPEAREFITEWADIRKALVHRPFQPESPAHRTFLENTLGKLEKVSQTANVSAEMAEVRQRLEKTK